jgi:16S rRNA (guanine1207-N2)-methyltransferase
MSHYYTNDPTLKSQEKSIEFKIRDQDFKLLVDRGTFAAKALDQGSKVLIEALLDQDLGGSGLDLGCGNGVISVVLKSFKNKLNLTLSDINERAVNLARKNLDLYQFDEVNVIVSDLFLKIPQKFDFIYFNPPIRAGKKVIYQAFRESYDHLNENGRLLLVMRRDLGAESAIKELLTLKYEIQIINKSKGYWVFVAHKKI